MNFTKFEIHLGCESAVFEQIRLTDENGWTCVQSVSCSPVFQHHWQEWLNIHPGCESLQCFSWWESLTRMAEHTSRLWVALVFEQMRPTEENCWTCVQWVSCYPVFPADENHWSEWLNMCPASELLFSVSTDEPLMRMAVHVFSLWVAPQCLQMKTTNPEWMNAHPESESLLRTTDKNGWTCV